MIPAIIIGSIWKSPATDNVWRVVAVRLKYIGVERIAERGQTDATKLWDHGETWWWIGSEVIGYLLFGGSDAEA